MDKDRLKGTARELGGSVKESVGDFVGDHELQAGGAVDQIAGRAQDLYGKAKDGLKDVIGSAREPGGAVDKVTGRAQDIYGKARDGLQDVVSSAREPGGTVDQVTGRAQDIYGKARDGLQDVVSNAGGYAGEAYDRGDDYARRGARIARREIKEYPLAAVVLAGAIGYLLAMSLHGRR